MGEKSSIDQIVHTNKKIVWPKWSSSDDYTTSLPTCKNDYSLEVARLDWLSCLKGFCLEQHFGYYPRSILASTLSNAPVYRTILKCEMFMYVDDFQAWKTWRLMS